MLKDVYSMLVTGSGYKWCEKKGVMCPRDEYGWFCDQCYRR